MTLGDGKQSDGPVPCLQNGALGDGKQRDGPVPCLKEEKRMMENRGMAQSHVSIRNSG